MCEHKIGRGGNVIDRSMRQTGGRHGGVADQRNDAWVIGVRQRLAVGGAKNLYLRQRIALETLDQDQIDLLEQAQKLGQPEYKVKAESGPDHRKRFLVEVRFADNGTTGKALARGMGSTKKKAEQEAARRAMVKLTTAKAKEAVDE